jgi:hypothetical protein
MHGIAVAAAPFAVLVDFPAVRAQLLCHQQALLLGVLPPRILQATAQASLVRKHQQQLHLATLGQHAQQPMSKWYQGGYLHSVALKQRFLQFLQAAAVLQLGVSAATAATAAMVCRLCLIH